MGKNPHAQPTRPTANSRLPLSALLSHLLIAFTIEFDNEAEHRLPHRTTNFGSTAGSGDAPWLVSMVMWTNCMRYIPEDGVSVGELYRKARVNTRSLRTMLKGLRRWGYLIVGPTAGEERAKLPASDWIIRTTPAGQLAQQIWQDTLPIIEMRWRKRFGEDAIDQLWKLLAALIDQFDCELPDGLPILEYGLTTNSPNHKRQQRRQCDTSMLSLPALISKVLLTFATEFERESQVSLAISANVLRILGEKQVSVRDIPRLSGVGKEAVAMSLRFLEKRGCTMAHPDPSGKRSKIVRLTAKGRKAREHYRDMVLAIEERWQTRFGKNTLTALRAGLEKIAGDSTTQSLLFRGLDPYAGGWRARIPEAERLPHFPVVMHRGGFPDGS